MANMLSIRDVRKIEQKLADAHEVQTEQLVGVVIPAIEAADISISHQLDDLAGDTALGFSEVHSKIEYLRSELNEIKQVLNSLFR